MIDRNIEQLQLFQGVISRGAGPCRVRTQSARNGMQPNPKLQAPNGDWWYGYASLTVQGDMIAGPVSWHPEQGDFGGTPDTIASQQQFTGNIVDPGSARGSAHDNKDANVDWVGASTFDCADAT